MKKFISLICVIFVFSLFAGLYGCSKPNGEIIIPPITEVLPDDDLDLEAEEQKRKKSYAVSSVDKLRIRTKPSSSSTVIGYLDKNDAVFILGQQNGYYETVYKEKKAFVYASYCSVMDVEISSDLVEKAIDIGSSLLGYPYVWGSQRYHWGNGKLNSNFVAGEFDCSAFVQYVYYFTDKVLLDVTSRAQVNNGAHVELNDLKRGDLMFFTNESRKNKPLNERIGHVGIYFGNNYVLHTASDHAVLEPISSLRWSYYITARRVI